MPPLSVQMAVQKKCPLENVVRTVPSNWVYCPYDGGLHVNSTLQSTAGLKIGPITPKWCPTESRNLTEAQSTWTHCPYDGAKLEAAHGMTGSGS